VHYTNDKLTLLSPSKARGRVFDHGLEEYLVSAEAIKRIDADVHRKKFLKCGDDFCEFINYIAFWISGDMNQLEADLKDPLDPHSQNIFTKVHFSDIAYALLLCIVKELYWKEGLVRIATNKRGPSNPPSLLK